MVKHTRFAFHIASLIYYIEVRFSTKLIYVGRPNRTCTHAIHYLPICIESSALYSFLSFFLQTVQKRNESLVSFMLDRLFFNALNKP